MMRTPLEEWICRKIGVPGPDLARSDLEACQLERINATLQWVAGHSRFYHQHLARSAHHLSSLDEIAFTTAGDLHRAGPGMLCVSQSEIERVVTLDTSGTTGEPKRLYFTHPDQELTIDFFQHGMSTFTRPGDRVLILLPYERPGSVGDLLSQGLGRLGTRRILYGPVCDPQPALEIIQSEKVTGLVGAPVQVLALARFFTLSAPARAWAPAQVLLSTDYVPPAVVAAIQSAWGCSVYNHYGMTETGLGGGVDCQARAGYHLREADLYVEIVDPHTGQPILPGQPGEVVFTTLTRQGMPLIRYRTGDRSCFLPRPCPCGTGLKTLQHVRGRYSGLIQLGSHPEEVLEMADLDDALIPLAPVLNCSARLSGSARHACLSLEVILLPGAAGDWRSRVETALESIPAVQAACQAGQLELQVSGQTYPGAGAGSLAKRKIIDLRSAADERDLE